MKKSLAFVLAIIMIVGFIPAAAFALENDVASVDVYLSVSDDDQYVVGTDTGTVMALQKITVPYFDIGYYYGLSNFYFASENYGPDDPDEPSSNLTPGTAEFAENKITMLHLLIYALEVFEYGQDPDDAGDGYLNRENLLGTDALDIQGSTGSLFFNQFWGMDYNLNYYLNYEYPVASSGWGATADQILLDDGDIITVGHFALDIEHNFFDDPNSIFSYATAAPGNNNTIDVAFYHAGADFLGTGSTAHTAYGAGIPVYYSEAGDDVMDPDVTEWNYLTTTDSTGHISVNPATLGHGDFIIAIAGQYGTVYDDIICSTPGGVIVTIP